MKSKHILSILLGVSASSNQVVGSALENYLTPEQIEMLGVEAQSQSRSSKKKERPKVSASVYELDEYVVEKIKDSLYKLVVDDELENVAFQTNLKKIRTVAYEKIFLKKLPSYGQANRSEEANKSQFAKIWKDAINNLYDEKNNEIDDDIRDLGIDYDSDQDQAAGMQDGTTTFKTTLLNILIRRVSSKELPLKVQTLIENGADKNLHKEFAVSPKMQNQSEYPLRVVLDKVGDVRLRNEILRVLLNDNVVYAYNNILDDIEEDGVKPVKHSLDIEGNKNFVLENLLDKKDFATFDLVLSYLEKSNIFVIADYEDEISQIKDQIYSPVLEKILSKMSKLRQKAVTTNRHSERTDNIKEFFESKHLASHMSQDNHDARFGESFRKRLEVDFSNLFDQISRQIETYRTTTEIFGENFKEIAIEWAMWANFRNRVASHLNLFALSASNKGERSNVIRLIRYTNIYNEGRMASNDDLLFKELHVYGGKDIIFKRTNKYGWTPLMYAMVQKQSEGIQLYLRQAPHEITQTDGVDNNIMHLAFPLPEQHFIDENARTEKNVLQLVGAEAAKHGVKEKTEESIKAVITERSIDKKDKVAALKQLSASNYTPVSLAAAMGYVDIYEYLVSYLKGEGEWNRDDHSHLDTHIEEIVVAGLKNYLEMKQDELTSEQAISIEKDIDRRQKEIEKMVEESIDEIYDSESHVAREYLEEIMAPARKILDEYEDQKGTKRARAPYLGAFDASFNVMLNPPYISVKVWKIRKKLVEEPVELRKAPENEYRPKKKWYQFGKKKEAEPEYMTVTRKIYVDEDYEDIEHKESPLAGMKTARSIVKSSYLGQVVKFVTTRYLRHHTSPRLLSFDVVYKGLTENETKDFFKEKFNQTVESRMQDVIRETLRESDRLREDELEEDASNNRFDTMDQRNRFEDGLGIFGAAIEEEYDSESDEDII